MRHLNFFSRMFVRILSIFSGIIPKKIIANSHNGKKDHINLGYEKSKIEVIHNGYNLNNINNFKKTSVRNYLRSQIGIDKDYILIGNIGRDHPMKDHSTFVRSAYFLKKINKVKFLILGKGIKQNKKLLKQINDKNLKNDFILLEPKSVDINDIYQILDIFCLTSSDSEGFPNVLVESIINNTLTVSTDVGTLLK